MSAAATKIAFLGTGRMGTPIVRNLLGAGFEVSAWNRTRERAEPLAEDGARIASSPAEAAGDAAVVVTMLTDGEAVEQTMSGRDGALVALPPQSVWVQMATVGLEWSARLGELASAHGAVYVDAPVSGSDQPARDAELVILGSGPEDARDRVQPIFDAISRRTLWLGAAGNGTRFKLVLNNWLVTQVEALAETVAMAESLGLDSGLVVETIAGGPLGSPYAGVKGREMIAGEFEAGFALRHAYKDAVLVLAAGREAAVDLPLTAALAPGWERTISDGHGDEDVGVVVTAARLPSRR
jgi:3-hydroxyisobutyrate dehydrogenase